MRSPHARNSRVGSGGQLGALTKAWDQMGGGASGAYTTKESSASGCSVSARQKRLVRRRASPLVVPDEHTREQ